MAKDRENSEGPLPSGFDWRAFTPEDSPKTPIDIFADPVHQDLASATVAPGEEAFDFERPLFDFGDGVARSTGERFKLSAAAANRPVALVFGSYT
jgi:hypothetical protein